MTGVVGLTGEHGCRTGVVTCGNEEWSSVHVIKTAANYHVGVWRVEEISGWLSTEIFAADEPVIQCRSRSEQ